MRLNQNLLRKVAMKSRRENRHSSIIYQGGTPVAFGYNNSELHAEERAIRYFSNMIGLSGNIMPRNSIMVNIRVTPGNKIGLAKPCPACMQLLIEKHFKKVIYSTNHGTFEEIIL